MHGQGYIGLVMPYHTGDFTCAVNCSLDGYRRLASLTSINIDFDNVFRSNCETDYRVFGSVARCAFRRLLVFCHRRLNRAATAGQLDEIGKTCALDVALSCLQPKADYVPAALLWPAPALGCWHCNRVQESCARAWLLKTA